MIPKLLQVALSIMFVEENLHNCLLDCIFLYGIANRTHMSKNFKAEDSRMGLGKPQGKILPAFLEVFLNLNPHMRGTGGLV